MEGYMLDFKRRRFQSDLILICVRWYLAYPLSYRNIEEMMKERGVEVDHSTINRWVLKYTPEIENKFRKYKNPVGSSWRMDETYIKVKGQWKYLYRAVDKEGRTVDFLLTARRDRKAAKRFFKKAIGTNGIPEKINIDKSGANTAGIKDYNTENASSIEIRQCKYLNNIIESDHRKVKQITNPMMGFQSFKLAKIVLAGIEMVAMLRKGQSNYMPLFVQNSVDAFYQLAS
jgi:putative transposase